MKQKQYVLGIDGGGTKTLAVIAGLKGNIKGYAKTTGSYDSGLKKTRKVLRNLINCLLSKIKISKNQVIAACYGLSGADKPCDFEIIHNILKPVTPTKNYLLANDANIVLRLGTDNYRGIAVIAGTGTNCVGINSKGKEVHIGGQGFGDHVGGYAIGRMAADAAYRAAEGRERKTILEGLIIKKLQLKDIFGLVHYPRKYLNFHVLCPLVFQAAQKGDRVAKSILRYHGKELALSVSTVARRIFKKNERIPLVLGGSLLQKPEDKTIINTIKQELRKKKVKYDMIVPKLDPVFGALFFAYDKAGIEVTTEIKNNLLKSWRNRA